MLRQKWGSVVCPSCGNLVGVQDDRCLNCGRWKPGMWGFAPLLHRFGRDLGFTPLIIWTCVGLYLLTLFTNPGNIRTGGGLFSFISPSGESLFLFGASGPVPVFGYGRWWTVMSAGWLHGGIIHILFSVMALRSLGPPVGELYGASRMVIIYMAANAAGFTASTLGGTFLGFLPFLGRGGITVGASAGLCGLLGALLYYGRRGGSRMIGEQAKVWLIGVVLIGLLPGIDNWAHAGGFAGGYLCSRLLDPLTPERLDHFVIALASLGLAALAIVVSIITGLPYVRV